MRIMVEIHDDDGIPKPVSMPGRRNTLKTLYEQDKRRFVAIIPDELVALAGGKDRVEVGIEDYQAKQFSKITIKDREPKTEGCPCEGFFELSIHDHVGPQSGENTLMIDMSLQDVRGERVTPANQHEHYPGQYFTGLGQTAYTQLMDNIETFAMEQGYDHVGAHPMFYHTYILLRQRGFREDPAYHRLGYSWRTVDELEGCFRREGVKDLRQRSWMVHEGTITDDRGEHIQWKSIADDMLLAKKVGQEKP